MNRFMGSRWAALGLGMTLALAAPISFAQRPDGNRGGARMGMGAPRLMERLNLTPAQKNRLDAMRDQHRRDLQALRSSDLSPEQKRERTRSLRDKQRRQIESILTPVQAARLKQLRAEQRSNFDRQRGERRGNRQRFVLSQMKTELNLTSSQESRIRAILKKAEAEESRIRSRRASAGGATDPAQRDRLRELRRTTMEQISGVLTPAQRRKSMEVMRRQRQDRMGRR